MAPQSEKFFFELYGEDVSDPKHGWRKSLEQKDKGTGITALLHQRAFPGKSLNIVRNTAVIKNVSMKAHEEFSNNWDKYQKDFDTYNSQVAYKMLESKEEGGIKKRLQYSRSKMGAMVSDRESLIYSEIKELGDGKVLSISNAVDRDDVPPSPDAVRMEFFKATQHHQVGTDIHVTEFQQMDMKGYFPKALMNKVMSSICLDHINKIGKICRKIDEQNGWTPDPSQKYD